MNIETSRLILREHTFEDLDSLVLQANDFEVAKFTNFIPHPFTKDDAEKWINEMIDYQKSEKRRSYDFAITLQEEGDYIGMVSLNNLRLKHKTANLSYFIGKNYWGKGYSTESAKAMIDFGFTQLKLKNIHVETAKENIGSKKVIEKIGGVYYMTAIDKYPSLATGLFQEKDHYSIKR